MNLLRSRKYIKYRKDLSTYLVHKFLQRRKARTQEERCAERKKKKERGGRNAEKKRKSNESVNLLYGNKRAEKTHKKLIKTKRKKETRRKNEDEQRENKEIKMNKNSFYIFSIIKLNTTISIFRNNKLSHLSKYKYISCSSKIFSN